jgi:UPF0042 nucleotide-binding protein
MAADRRLIIVSGLSGSGKSIALHVLEDLGYYCMDNLPAALLQAAVSEVGAAEDPQSRRIAVGIDARNRHRDLESLPKLVQQFRDQDILTDVLFLQADEEVLLKRYSESRRRHPLSTHGAELRSAIEQEREILADVIDTADLIIDTSSLSVYDLADTIRERVDGRRKGAMSVLIESFGRPTQTSSSTCVAYPIPTGTTNSVRSPDSIPKSAAFSTRTTIFRPCTKIFSASSNDGYQRTGIRIADT